MPTCKIVILLDLQRLSIELLRVIFFHAKTITNTLIFPFNF